MLSSLRPLMAKIWQAPAKALLRAGIHPNAVTIVGTIGVVFGAVFFFPRGGTSLAWGVLVIVIFVMTDMLDGTMARLSGKTSRLGAFLDSTLDRVADAAIFGALVWTYRDDTWTGLGALLCLAIGSLVPYARAKAESLDVEAAVGIAERSDRLVLGLGATLAVGLGAPVWVLTIVLWLLALAAAITVGQRTWRVVLANREDLDDADDHHRDSLDYQHHPDDAPGRPHTEVARADEAPGDASPGAR
ncbi:phosphatidylinositol phosphate synthase [Demequina sp. NBRC 110054]|uniref:phosphatidylinositol phosphate synthase n=1 Tax=Demequina sp. NBRC 110054 TaxID=1570343 RepID=UPI000A0426A2|nr:CDP-alcohol phosphatidyltransferase family protein [Demequina sp. NBRC 110054]